MVRGVIKVQQPTATEFFAKVVSNVNLKALTINTSILDDDWVQNVPLWMDKT